MARMSRWTIRCLAMGEVCIGMEDGRVAMARPLIEYSLNSVHVAEAAEMGFVLIEKRAGDRSMEVV